jgi:CRISPR-associated protein Cas2
MSRLWVIAYDIVDNRTRRRVEKALLNCSARIQESVFEGIFTHSGVRALRRELAGLIDVTVDSIRFYPLCNWCQETLSWQGQGRRHNDPHYYLY